MKVGYTCFVFESLFIVLSVVGVASSAILTSQNYNNTGSKLNVMNSPNINANVHMLPEHLPKQIKERMLKPGKTMVIQGDDRTMTSEPITKTMEEFENMTNFDQQTTIPNTNKPRKLQNTMPFDLNKIMSNPPSQKPKPNFEKMNIIPNVVYDQPSPKKRKKRKKRKLSIIGQSTFPYDGTFGNGYQLLPPNVMNIKKISEQGGKPFEKAIRVRKPTMPGAFQTYVDGDLFNTAIMTMQNFRTVNGMVGRIKDKIFKLERKAKDVDITARNVNDDIQQRLLRLSDILRSFKELE